METNPTSGVDAKDGRVRYGRLLRPAPLARRVPGRVLRFARKRLWLTITRVRHPRARFGAGCDVRRGLELRIGPSGSVLFGSRCILDRSMTVECEGRLVVGSGTIFGHHCTIAARESIVIGEDCLIAEMVSIRDHDHRFDDPEHPTRAQGAIVEPLYIGRNVWLGSKVTVVRGVTIGDNVVVGANAVVSKNLPDNAVAVGVPARVLYVRPGPEFR